MKILTMPTAVRESLGDPVSEALLHFMTDAIEMEDNRIEDKIDKRISEAEIKMMKWLFGQTIFIVMTIIAAAKFF